MASSTPQSQNPPGRDGQHGSHFTRNNACEGCQARRARCVMVDKLSCENCRQMGRQCVVLNSLQKRARKNDLNSHARKDNFVRCAECALRKKRCDGIEGGRSCAQCLTRNTECVPRGIAISEAQQAAALPPNAMGVTAKRQAEPQKSNGGTITAAAPSSLPRQATVARGERQSKSQRATKVRPPPPAASCVSCSARNTSCEFIDYPEPPCTECRRRDHECVLKHDLPGWLQAGLTDLKLSHPNDSFEGLMAFTPVNTEDLVLVPGTGNLQAGQNIKYQYLPKIPCHDCPEKLYEPRVDNFKLHLYTRQHKKRVEERITKAGSTTPAIAGSPRSEGAAQCLQCPPDSQCVMENGQPCNRCFVNDQTCVPRVLSMSTGDTAGEAPTLKRKISATVMSKTCVGCQTRGIRCEVLTQPSCTECRKKHRKCTFKAISLGASDDSTSSEGLSALASLVSLQVDSGQNFTCQIHSSESV